MINFFRIALLFSLISPATFGDVRPLTLSSPACGCPTSSEDEFEEPQAFHFGRFAGQCIDSCRFRAAKILRSNQPLRANSKPGALLVANILHLEKYYLAAIPLENFTKVSLGLEEFYPGIYHVFLKFELASDAPPLQLRAQSRGRQAIASTRTLVISSEGVPPKGHKYRLLESYFDSYLFVHRLTSGEECARWTNKLKHPVKFFELNLKPRQVGQILANAINTSDQTKIKSVYRLFTNNCATASVDFVLSGFAAGSRPRSPWFQMDKALPIAGPLNTIKFLQRMNLISSL